MTFTLTFDELAVLADCVTQARENTEEVAEDSPALQDFYRTASALEERLSAAFLREVLR